MSRLGSEKSRPRDQRTSKRTRVPYRDQVPVNHAGSCRAPRIPSSGLGPANIRGALLRLIGIALTQLRRFLKKFLFPETTATPVHRDGRSSLDSRVMNP
jgi:hypothetical protein